MIGAQTTNLLESAEDSDHSIIRHPSQDLIWAEENYYSAASASDTAIYNRDDDFITIIENLDSLDALLN
ncbi:MAG: hypothetical protein CUN55_19765 [Phototrophicales bacterium]|nr:MAG: hypothetical protein CUN55_19765 [Phototrophicales bacterium]